MELLVVRHALALDKDEAKRQGMLDRDRPLTTDGKTKMKRIARGLWSRVPEISVLLTSPWRRAVETGDLLQKAYASFRRIETDALLPDAEPEALASQVSEHAAAAAMALVGHEPHLSRWVSWCLTGSLEPLIELRKGGACLLRFEDIVGPGRARLIWLMTPAVLRQL
jgi:phosphohistidine phosphatase